MTLQLLIENSYDKETFEFAALAQNVDNVAASIVEVKKAGISFDQFLSLHKTFLETSGCDEAHVAQQLKEIKNLRGYF